MASATDVVGYAYEADVHCVTCAEHRFGWSALQKHHEEEGCAEDAEGNPVTPIFNGEDAYEECLLECCTDGQHECPCCSERHDCSTCDGSGQVSRKCGDCGQELIG